MVRKVLLGGGIVSSVWYVMTDVLGSLQYPGYRYTEQQFSELLAVGSPVRPFMIALNAFPYTLLVGAFAVGVCTSAAPKHAARLTAAMLLGYAAFGFAGGVLFPVPTREVAAAGEGTLRNTMHIPGTVVMSLFFVLAVVFGSKLLGKRFRYYSYGTLLAVLVFGFLTSLQAPQIEVNQPTP